MRFLFALLNRFSGKPQPAPAHRPIYSQLSIIMFQAHHTPAPVQVTNVYHTATGRHTASYTIYLN